MGAFDDFPSPAVAMPIHIRCTNCPATVKVQDEHIGRRVGCPKCNTVLTATAPVPTPPSPAKPQPDTPAAKPAEEGWELVDDKPTRKRRRSRDDDDDDDLPDSRRRPRHSNRESRGSPLDTRRQSSRRKGMVWALVGGGVLALLLVVCVVSALVNPQKNPLAGLLTPANPNVTEENFNKIKWGMTLAEVETILGKGRPPSRNDLLIALTPGGQGGGRQTAYQAAEARMYLDRIEDNAVKLGFLWCWSNGSRYIQVDLTAPPNMGGKVKGHFYTAGNGGFTIMGDYNGLNDPPPELSHLLPPLNQRRGRQPAFELTADAFLREYATNRTAANLKFGGKMVKLTGVVKEYRYTPIGPGVDNDELIVENSGSEFTLKAWFHHSKEEHAKVRHIKTQDRVTFIGNVGLLLTDIPGFANSKDLMLTECGIVD